MDRLVEAIDETARKMPEEEFFIQLGNSNYIPKYMKYERLIKKDEFYKAIEKCDVLVTHSGVGSIMNGLQLGKKVLVVPRLAKYNEHVDDHQVEIAEAFEQNRYAMYCKDLANIEAYIDKIREFEFNTYETPECNIENIIIDKMNQWMVGK